ncbi:MAG: tetratricopeptide repeat protein [Verrucomicrobiales bacterium]|nr:tetratricopeptide repeat protein [Verrucomicrobiales bacterium]
MACSPGPVPEILCSRVSAFVAETMGLHFPPERWADLQRGLAAAAVELGFADVVACVQGLLSPPITQARLRVLASHLTVGETYFFREKKTFDVLTEHVFPELIRSKRNGELRLRLWSAGCCTGEEPYSLAILLQQIIPDLLDWHVTILATDINERFLQKAAKGLYGEWSFREAPTRFKERYFQREADRQYSILPGLRKRVAFAQFNLVEDAYPSLATDTNAMDLIFCRNVLMYFTPPQIQNVVRNLRHALVDGGWLVVGSSESLRALSPGFAAMNFSGVTLYQKVDASRWAKQPWAPATRGDIPELIAQAFEGPFPCVAPLAIAPAANPLPSPPAPEAHVPSGAAATPLAMAAPLYRQGRYAEAADTLLAASGPHAPADPQTFSLLARALANQGKLSDALAWCDRWVAADKLDSSGHYLRAIVLQELGHNEEARRSLQRALYLQPDFVLAHFALANLARCGGRITEAGKHFATSLRLLGNYQPGDLLPESDGLTAGRLSEIISSIMTMEAAR